ncbi:two-component regulator propeller domain-containing protein [Thalassotalea fusca]
MQLGKINNKHFMLAKGIMAQQFFASLLTLFLLSQFASAKSDLVDYFDHYGFEQNISQGSVNCMVRDKNGYLWVGTQGGLNRFNGIEFSTYLADGSDKNPSGNWITGCAMDTEGNLWFSTKSAGINKLSSRTQRFITLNSINTDNITDDRFNTLFIENEKYLWAGGANGELFRVSLLDNTVTRFKVHEGSISKINRIVKGIDGKLWLATGSGLYYLSDTHLKPVENVLTQENPIEGELWTLAIDHTGNLWIGGKKGLYLLSHSSDGYMVSSQSVKAWVTGIVERTKGVLWITTYGSGLYIFEPDFGIQQRFVKKDRNAYGLRSDYLISINKDSDDQIWLGSDGKGLQRYLISRNRFHHTSHDPEDELTISHAFVRAVSTEKDGTLWVGTRNGLNRKSPNGSGFIRYFFDESQPNSLPNNNVFALHVTEEGTVWVGTYGGGLAKYNHATDDFTRYSQASGLPSSYIYAITSSSDKELWLGTNKGLIHFDPSTEESRHYYHKEGTTDSLSQNTVVSLYDEGKDSLWVGTFLGLNRFDKNTGKFTHFKKNPLGLTDNVVTSLMHDSRGDLWVGTMNGLNRIDGKSFEITQFGVENGLPNGNVFGIVEDNTGNLWMSTNNGLAKFNISDQNFSIYSVGDGLQDRAYILGAYYRDNRGRLYFGGVNGFNWFTPESLALEPKTPNVMLEDFLLFNKAIDEKSLIKRTKGEFIELSHEDVIFGVRFSAPLATHPEKLQFAYRLNGFDTNWINATALNRVATYTNIPAGEFELKIKTRYAGGAWSKNLTVPIKIKPAPWFSSWAISLYVLLSGIFLWSFWQMHYKKKLAEQQKRHAEIVANAKDELLANVSHEFKTPITLILGPTNELIQTSNVATKRQLEGIKRNAEKLDTLVSNILANKTLDISHRVECTDILAIGLSMANEFSVLAKEHHQQVEYVTLNQQEIFVDIESEKVELVISNLLSNAIKYAGEHCSVELRIWSEGQHCFILVQDTGVGIPENELDSVFERGFRGAGNKESSNGHGIGLSLVKDILEQKNGEIKLTSRINEGARFLVKLPLAIRHTILTQTPSHNIQRIDKGKKLLIIDDNAEICLYLSQILSSHYRCQMSSDGKEGLARALEWQPDVIISDVMMPNMNGLELLQALRTNDSTCHIPVLMLSAYPSKTLKLNTLSLLADEFLPKPFDKAELFAALSNILAIRAMSQQKAIQQLHDSKSESLASDNPTQSCLPAHNVKDARFIERVNSLLAEHYTDAEFSLAALAQKMFMSERNLQIKTKALFGVSPVDLIREVRLHQATLALCGGADSVGDITLQCGFNSQSYFTKCFKEKYGMTPNAYRKLKRD